MKRRKKYLFSSIPMTYSKITSQPIINAMNSPTLQQTLVVAGKSSPRDLLLRRDLATRLASGLVFWLQPLTDDDKHAALKAYAQSSSFDLRDDVAAYLLRHGRRDMATLFNTVDRLDQYAIQYNKPITLALLREMRETNPQK